MTFLDTISTFMRHNFFFKFLAFFFIFQPMEQLNLHTVFFDDIRSSENVQMLSFKASQFTIDYYLLMGFVSKGKSLPLNA